MQKILVSKIILLFFLWFTPGAFAMSVEEDSNEKKESAFDANINSECLFDYHAFLYRESYVPFQTGKALWDVVHLTQCQALDMLKIYDELNEVREQMRQQALSCSSNYDELKDLYLSLKLEQIFIREIWPHRLGTFTEARLKKEAEKIPETLEALRESMKQDFIHSEGIRINVPEKTFDQWFDAWTIKYEDRIEDYMLCRKDAWAEVTEIKDNIEGFFEDFENAYKEFLASLMIRQNVKNYYQDLGLFKKQDEGQSRFQFVHNFGQGELEKIKNAWLDGATFYEQKKIDQPIQAPQGYKELSMMSYADALKQVRQEEDHFDLAVRARDREARYRVRFGNNSQSSQSFYVNELNLALDSASRGNHHILKMLSKGEAIYERQCR